jgi:hypothetical protein
MLLVSVVHFLPGRKVNPLQLSLARSLNLSMLISAMRACWRTCFRVSNATSYCT